MYWDRKIFDQNKKVIYKFHATVIFKNANFVIYKKKTDEIIFWQKNIHVEKFENTEKFLEFLKIRVNENFFNEVSERLGVKPYKTVIL